MATPALIGVKGGRGSRRFSFDHRKIPTLPNIIRRKDPTDAIFPQTSSDRSLLVWECDYAWDMEYLFLATYKPQHLDMADRLLVDYGYSPSVWIGPKQFASSVARRFPKSYFLSKEDLLEPKAADYELKLEDLNLLSRYWESVAFLEQRVNLLEEFNRYPRVNNLRTVDREVILRNIQIRALAAIRLRPPRFLIASDVPHNPVNLAIFMLARWLEIPTLFFDSTLVAPCMIPKTDLDKIFQFENNLRNSQEGHIIETYAFLYTVAKSNLDQVASESETQWQAVEVKRIREQVPRRFARINEFRTRISRSLLRLRDPKSALLADFLDDRYESLIEAHRPLPVESGLEPHGLFALQFQPEATAVPKGMVDTFQGQAIVMAREMLDSKLTLVVKEHPSQLKTSMEGSFGRSPYLYRWVDALPGVSMVSGFTPSRVLLQRAKIVFTLVGSIGLEAAFGGVPVVYFGAPWWAGLPGTYHYREPDLASKLESYRRPTHDEIKSFVLDLIDNFTIPGIPDFGEAGTWWNRKLPEQFEDAFLDCFSEVVGEFAKSKVVEK